MASSVAYSPDRDLETFNFSEAKKSEVDNSQNPETTYKVKKVWGAILLVLGALTVAAGVVALVVPPVGAALGLAGTALLAVGVSFVGGGFILSTIGSFLLGRSVQTKRHEEDVREEKIVDVHSAWDLEPEDL